MNFFKILLKILGSVIVLILLLLIADYIRLNAFYLLHRNSYTEAFNVQGNKSNYVPQGLAYSSKYNVALQTSYNSKHSVSMLYVIDFNTGKLIKELKLLELDDTENINHVGGIATNNSTVWITNDYEVNEFSLDEIINTENNYIKSLKNTKLPNRGDFCTYNNNILWIGDFFLKPFYNVPNDTPLLMGYNLNNSLDYSSPDYIISLPKMVQGMVITPDNKFVFTSSFTNLVQSNLSVYNNPLVENSNFYDLNGKKVPYYHFNKNNLIKNIKFPPMIEGLFNIDNDLFILFENSSDTYFYAYPKMHKVIKYQLRNF